MQKMPNIDLTYEDYDILVYSGKLKHGGEAIICHGTRPDTLYKMFTYQGTTLPCFMSDNKYKKVLHQYEEPLDNSTNPISTISLNGNLIGYELTYDKKDIALESLSLSRQDLIYYLKQIKKVLEYYESKDITYGDIKSDNILINPTTRSIKFCDMDNIRMGELPIDLLGYDLSCFRLEHGSLDETTHAYMHNLLTLQQLNYQNASYQDIIYRLSNGYIPKGFKKSAKRVLPTIARAEHFQGEYLIDHIKTKR